MHRMYRRGAVRLHGARHAEVLRGLACAKGAVLVWYGPLIPDGTRWHREPNVAQKGEIEARVQQTRQTKPAKSRAEKRQPSLIIVLAGGNSHKHRPKGPPTNHTTTHNTHTHTRGKDAVSEVKNIKPST